jgi:transposase
MKRAIAIGIDASKQTLEISIFGQSKTRRIENTVAAVDQWLAQFTNQRCRIGIESTGRCHQLLMRCAVQAKHTVYVLNANDLSHYMRSLGRRAKTDRLDAQGIASYVAKHSDELHPYELPSESQSQLGQLIQRRHVLVKTCTAIRQSFSELEVKLAGLPKLLQAHAAALKQIDAHIAALVQQDEHLGTHARRLKTVVGFGPLLSSVMAHLLTRHCFRNGDSVVAYLGLDTRANDSGKHQGRRFLTKRGPGELRRLLYCGAMSASNTKVWKPLYEYHRARGLARTQVLVILARVLVRIAFSMFKNQVDFNPALILKKACVQP